MDDDSKRMALDRKAEANRRARAAGRVARERSEEEATYRWADSPRVVRVVPAHECRFTKTGPASVWDLAR